jgi:hypothetical protein
MATCNIFNKFRYQIGLGCYDFSADTLKFALTNTAPTLATDTVYLPGSLHPVPAAADGYTSGGYAATIGWSETGGIASLTCTVDVTITAGSGGIGPYRYVLLYDDTASSPLADPLICYWDYGTSITITSENFRLDVTATLFTIS